MRNKTGFNAVARRHGFVVIYPSGVGRKWNDGRTRRNQVDDVGYLTALIQSLIDNGSANRKQIFVAGHSNGGGMAMRMACERPDLVRAIAVVATKVPLNYPCRNGKPIPAMFIYGTADPISPPEGRTKRSRLGGAFSAQASVELWRKRNRCSNNARSQTIDRRDDGTSATVLTYRGCSAALSFINIQGHGHAWPRPGTKATRLQGPASQEVDATATVWRFFDAYR